MSGSRKEFDRPRRRRVKGHVEESGRSNDAADAAQIALAGGGLMNNPG
jgi:hypothetical protein